MPVRQWIRRFIPSGRRRYLNPLRRNTTGSIASSPWPRAGAKRAGRSTTYLRFSKSHLIYISPRRHEDTKSTKKCVEGRIVLHNCASRAASGTGVPLRHEYPSVSSEYPFRTRRNTKKGVETEGVVQRAQ